MVLLDPIGVCFLLCTTEGPFLRLLSTKKMEPGDRYVFREAAELSREILRRGLAEAKDVNAGQSLPAPEGPLDEQETNRRAGWKFTIPPAMEVQKYQPPDGYWEKRSLIKRDLATYYPESRILHGTAGKYSMSSMSTTPSMFIAYRLLVSS